MPGSLFDTNVWIAVVFPTHPLHESARQVLENATTDHPALFCRATEQSFLRLCSTPALLKAYGAEDFGNRTALSLFNSLLHLPQIGERDEPAGLRERWNPLAALPSASPKVWMDAYLAAFAICGKLQLVTLDADFQRFEVDGLQLKPIA